MKKVMDTVDSEWRSPLAEFILERWGYDHGSVLCLRASANFIFQFKKDGKEYYLRFNDSCERDLDMIQAELRILQALNDPSLNVAQPVRSTNGSYVEAVETELGTFYAVVFEALRGKHYETTELNSQQIFLWGSSLGKLHEAFKQLPETYEMNRPTWKDRILTIKEILPSYDKEAYEEMDRLISWADRLNISKENYGLIHYDFELDNVVFEKDKIGILDFDDCSSYWYAADIIYALREIEVFSLESPVIKTFIEGYQSETTLDLDILHEYDGFIRLHKLISFAKIIRSVDIEESQEYPDWLINLREKLCRLIEQYRPSIV